MYIPEEVIGIITIIAIGVLLLLRLSKQEDYVIKWRSIIHHSDYSYEFDHFRNNNRRFNERQAIKHFLTPTRKQKVLDSYNKHVKSAKEWEDQSNKEKIKRRVFSYEYEDLIYSLFSDQAQKNKYSGEWEIPISSYIPENKIITEIKHYYNINDQEAHSKLKLLVDKGLLDNHLYGDKYDMGSILKYNPNIISESDMNFNKWMNTHTSTK